MSAIESLKRGLLINPNHFFCRFNHGVLMFKFGLIGDAEKDFRQLTEHPHGKKDPWVFYNLATCMIQSTHPKVKSKADKMLINCSTVLNRSKPVSIIDRGMGAITAMLKKATINTGRLTYHNASKACKRAVELGGNDEEIKIDALNLQGICEFRLGNLIESVGVLHKAKMLRARKIAEEDDRRERLRKKCDLDEIEGNYFSKRDMLAIGRQRTRSFDFKRHKKLNNP